MLTLTPLRSAIAGLCLFAGMASAQAALTITFEQDDNTGHLNISLSGEQAVPFNIRAPAGGTNLFSDNGLYASYSGYFTGSSWALQGEIPWTGTYSNPIVATGSGGFLVRESGVHFESATSGNLMTWDGSLVYIGNLAGIGLADGQSGSFGFSLGGDSFTVSWSAVVIQAVPEPATYALVLGLGIAGIALVRRRASRR